MNKNYDLVMDIAMNLNRVGNWAADGFDERKSKIGTFLDNTSLYIKNVDKDRLPSNFIGTWNEFLEKYKEFEKEGLSSPNDELYWGEQMMTWGNILTHRSKLLIPLK